LDRVTRRQILTAGGAAALASAVVGSGVAAAQADRPMQSPWALTLDVSIDEQSMDAVRQPAGGAMTPTGPGFASGRIYTGGTLGGDGTVPASALYIGTFRAVGWIFNAERVHNGGMLTIASFDMRGRGELVASGVLDDRVAVTAGTGDYRNAQGQAEVDFLSDNAFRVWFDIATP
jgi:hypothetical protein